LWQKAADRVRDTLGQVGYETWIGPLNFLGMEGGTATIEAPNRFFRDWVSDRYLRILTESLSAEASKAIEVKLTLGKQANGILQEPEKRTAPESLPVIDTLRRDQHPQLSPRYTFAEFVVGSANQFAHAAALAVANQPGEKYNPLFIYGGVGLGKTHLLNAIGHHIYGSGDPPRKGLFMPAPILLNQLIHAFRPDKMNEVPHQFPPGASLILDPGPF